MLAPDDAVDKRCFVFHHIKFDSCRGSYELLNKSTTTPPNYIVERYVGRDVDVELTDATRVDAASKQIKPITFPRLKFQHLEFKDISSRKPLHGNFFFVFVFVVVFFVFVFFFSDKVGFFFRS